MAGGISGENSILCYPCTDGGIESEG